MAWAHLGKAQIGVENWSQYSWYLRSLSVPYSLLEDQADRQLGQMDFVNGQIRLALLPVPYQFWRS